MKNLVLTGGFGMLGSNALLALEASYENIIIIDSNIRDMKKFTMSFWADKKLDLSKLIMIEKDIRALKSIDVQCHLIEGEVHYLHLADIVAGIGYVFNNQFSILDENTNIDLSSFKLAKAIGASKVLYASTACVFNQDSQRTIDSKISIDTDLYPANPESTYGWAKLFGEIALFNLFKDDNVDASVIYFHNLIGFPCDYNSSKAQMVPSIITRALKIKESGNLDVWGSGNQGRAFVPVERAAEAIKLMFEMNNPPLRTQVGPKFCTSVREVANMIADNVEPDVNIVFDLTKPEGDIGRSVGNDIQIITEITQSEISTSIGRTLQWIREQECEK
jgi:nucleoside-diphosphate-sugar epimerase